MRKTANILLTERWIMISWVFIVGAIQVATNWKSGQEIEELKSEKLR